MSSKSSPQDSGHTKMLPPPEMIMTRKKSAQCRQLRKKDRSMKRITQLLMRGPPKSPKKTTTNTNIKAKASSPKSPKKLTVQSKPLPKKGVKKSLVEVANKEYYPDKIKRKIKVKKVTLKSKHKLTIVNGLNKRKRTTPKSTNPMYQTADLTQTMLDKSPGSRAPSPTVEELLLMKEDSLDDEDLMEILTCPSPVWWEDPPDKTYSEDPLSPTKSERSKEDKQTSDTTQNTKLISELSSITKEKQSKEVSVSKLGETYTKKRSALENFVLNIKTKILDKNGNVERDINAPYSNRTNMKDEDKYNINRKRKRTSESSEELFVSPDNDDALNDLESIIIPVEDDENATVTSKSEVVGTSVVKSENIETERNGDSQEMVSEIENALEVCLEEADRQVIKKNPITKRVIYKHNFVQNKHNMSPKTLIWTGNNGDKKFINLVNDSNANNDKEIKNKQTHDIDIPELLPPLQKFSKVMDIKMTESPTHSKIENSEEDSRECSSNVSNQESDTISDTNITFLDDQVTESGKVVDINNMKQFFAESDEIKAKNRNIKVVDEQTDKLHHIHNKKDCVVVYKIVDKDDSVKKINQASKLDKIQGNITKTNVNSDATEVTNLNSSINNFFKQCKPGNRQTYTLKTKKEIEQNNKIGSVVKKQITVANNKILNYCLKCSSIFDTDECKYCANKRDIKKRLPLAVSGGGQVFNYCLNCSSIFHTKQCSFCIKKAPNVRKNLSALVATNL